MHVAPSSSDVDVIAIFRSVETSAFTSENFADFVVIRNVGFMLHRDPDLIKKTPAKYLWGFLL